MKSPFPGMDPYLERHWRDVHARMVLYACDEIEGNLPRDLIARVEERIVFETDEEVRRYLYPDIRVVERPGRGTGNGGNVAVADEIEAESLIAHLDAEPNAETFIEIRDTDGRRVVTVIEFISITNKVQGGGSELYVKKQQELLQAEVNLVEIDLLRGGQRHLIWPTARFPARVAAPYQALVRYSRPGKLTVYGMPLRRPLPDVEIPLRPQDTPIKLRLQPLLEQAYRKGRYADTIDYRQPPEPPLEGEDAVWADQLLREAGKRTGM